MDAMPTSIAPIFDLQVGKHLVKPLLRILAEPGSQLQKSDGGEANALDKAAQLDASESPAGQGHAAIAEVLQQGALIALC